jgi:hypothetical protein
MKFGIEIEHKYIRFEAFMVTELDKISGIRMMMEAEMVSKTLGFCPQLTWIAARDDFIQQKHVNKFYMKYC